MRLGNVAYFSSELSGRLFGAVSVKEFGAVGDGETDDTQAFQDALNSDDPVIVVPPGVYLLSGISIPSHKTLIGVSKTQSVLQLVDTPSGPLISIAGTGTNNRVEFVTVENLTLRHRTDYSGPGGTGSLILGAYTRGITVRGVVFRDFSVHGISMGYSDVNNSWHVDGCSFLNGGNTGFNVTAGGEYWRVTNCLFQAVGRGVFDSNGGNGSITDCTFFGCGDAARSFPSVQIRFTGGNGGKPTIANNIINHSKFKGVVITTSGEVSKGAIITGNHFRINEGGHNHLEILGSRDNLVMGNHFTTARDNPSGAVLIADDGSNVSDGNVVINNVLTGVTLSDTSSGLNTIEPNWLVSF